MTKKIGQLKGCFLRSSIQSWLQTRRRRLGGSNKERSGGSGARNGNRRKASP